jgi:hypothetical protein
MGDAFIFSSVKSVQYQYALDLTISGPAGLLHAVIPVVVALREMLCGMTISGSFGMFFCSACRSVHVWWLLKPGTV